MAARAISGVTGVFAFTGHVFRATRWSLSSQQDVHDTTGFAAVTNWRTVTYGLKSYRLQASGYALEGAVSNAPAADFSATNDSTVAGVAFTLTENTGTTYTGTAYPTSFIVSTDVNGVATVVMEGVGIGALVETVATS